MLRDRPPIPVGISNAGNERSLAAEVHVEAIDGHGQRGEGTVAVGRVARVRIKNQSREMEGERRWLCAATKTETRGTQKRI